MTISPIFPPSLGRQVSLRGPLFVCGIWIQLLLVCGGMILALSPSTSRADGVADQQRLRKFQIRYERIHEQFAREMNALADECAAQSFFQDAEEIRRRAQPPSAGAYDLDDLPEETLPEIPVSLPEEERRWRLKLRKLQTDYSNDLYRIARDALHQGYPSLTFQLIREVAFHNPDNRNARGMLGYVQEKNRWTTSFARIMKLRNLVDHPQFGWIDEKFVPRYENGERYFQGRWISAEKEAAIRSDFNYAWEVGTEHFLVKTNHSLEKGVEISRALEEFHDFFLREYSAFFNSPQQMERLLESGSRARWDPKDRYTVYYYRNKDEFVAALKPRQPQIERANGLYMPYDRIAYFYYDEQPGDTPEQRAEKQETMFHEVTHQLLGESRPRTVDVGEAANFWVIEGFPCYLESYRSDAKPYHVGNPRHIRIYWARRRALEENIYWPMRQFTRLGKKDFPLEADAYNQAAGMTHFFLNYRDGIYRDAFIQYLSEIYSPTDRLRREPVSLEKLIGVSYELLDEQYLEHLKSLPSDPPPSVKVIRVQE